MINRVVGTYVVKPHWRGDGLDNFRFVVTITESADGHLYGFIVESIELKRVRPTFARLRIRLLGEDALLRCVVEVQEPQVPTPEEAWLGALRVFGGTGEASATPHFGD